MNNKVDNRSPKSAGILVLKSDKLSYCRDSEINGPDFFYYYVLILHSSVGAVFVFLEFIMYLTIMQRNHALAATITIRIKSAYAVPVW